MFGIILYNGRKVFIAGTKAPQVLGDRPVSGKTGMTGKHILLFLFRMEKVFLLFTKDFHGEKSWRIGKLFETLLG